MTAKTFVLGLALLGGSAGAQQTSAAPPAIALRVQPDRICADSRSGYPNFDLLVRNGSARPATAVELTARSFDAAGNLLEHRILWQDALSILGPYFHDLDILVLAPSKEVLPVGTGDVLLPR